uniref:Homeobox protein ceh-22-like n=1 Tax=Kryptolebias marmoratus TaxID=37003 RepID=A0A3Q2ZQZ3_KRYMA
MADWKTQVTYNFNPSYHAYAFVYQPEQNPGNPTGLGENRVADLSGFGSGATQTFYAAATPARIGESYSEQLYQDSDLVHVGETQSSHLLLAEPQEGAGNEVRRTRRGSSSDMEAHTSPDSWSSVNSHEGTTLPQADPSIWAERDGDLNKLVGSPTGIGDVSSSVVEDPQASASFPSTLNVQLSASKTVTPAAESCTKASGRTTFSECQMEVLSKRFSAQKYLTPAEMKNLAKQTGLTYKQVKTWFQNRRMKLRKYQRDTRWASERYAFYNNVFANMATPVSIINQGHPQLREHYSQHSMEAALKNTPQNLAYYLGAGSAGFPHWSSNSPQAAGWPVAPGANHFDYMFNSNNFAPGPSLDCKDGDPVGSQNSVNAVMVPNTNQ